MYSHNGDGDDVGLVTTDVGISSKNKQPFTISNMNIFAVNIILTSPTHREQTQ